MTVSARTTLLTIAFLASFCHALAPLQAQAAPFVASAPAASLKNGRDWANLSPAQKKALAPLAGQWKQLEPNSRDKWLGVADRFPNLSPQAQVRMQERMTEWARMAPHERGEARLRFQNTRELSTQDRQQRWDAYQSLSAEQKDKLVQQAKAKQDAAKTARAVVASSPQDTPVASTLHPVRSMGTSKSNVVPDPSRLSSVVPQAVSPGVVKAGPGATTNLVNQKARPPAHQQPGMPKIAANSTYVDPVTLLPKPDRAGASPAGSGAAASPAPNVPAAGNTPPSTPQLSPQPTAAP